MTVSLANARITYASLAVFEVVYPLAVGLGPVWLGFFVFCAVLNLHSAIFMKGVE